MLFNYSGVLKSVVHLICLEELCLYVCFKVIVRFISHQLKRQTFKNSVEIINFLFP